MPASQAGRRGFDPRLPLHLFNNLTHHASFGFTSFTSITLFSWRNCHLNLGVGQSAFELGNRVPSTFDVALCVRVDRDSNRVSPLIGGHFRVDALFMPQTRLCPAQYLEVHPSHAAAFQLLLYIPPQ